MPRYLIQRRRGWYAVLEIPKDLHKHFRKSRFKETLKTDSLTVAEKRVLPLIVQWQREIDRVRKGFPANSIQDAHREADKFRRQGITNEDIMDIAYDALVTINDQGQSGFTTEEDEKKFLVAIQEVFPLETYIEDWYSSLKNEAKTKEMKKADVQRFVKTFPDAFKATEHSVMLWVEETLIDKDGLAPATCRRIMSACRDYWKWLARYKSLKVASPFTSEVVPKKYASKDRRTAGNKRAEFSVEDYHKLLNAVPENDDALRDLIVLGAHTGARIEELCSLTTENVTKDRLKIVESKTEEGVREIPIHSEIKQLVAKLKEESKDGFLMSGLTFNKYGDRSNAIGKKFGRLKESLGFGRSHVFHSFRKSVAQQLEDAEVLENFSARLLGHRIATMSYGHYSGKLSFKRLQETMEKVSWTT
ncbi:DUF6538 domain-containing protein [Rubellimicrobium aerolatum]|uniref:DUF6538 domain-containing protein n=1 Tax=Rubellimicrobium aerolatum TaxID=490979 RepID=A0ABW0SBR9_9RHOB|nr:DUF6538 domain-containing protein [Rubellimicrobium aerolatum]MBP1805858.1 integrase [Rubellimicrobium aerolatum]